MKLWFLNFTAIVIALLAQPFVIYIGASSSLFGVFLFGTLYFSNTVIPLIRTSPSIAKIRLVNISQDGTSYA